MKSKKLDKEIQLTGRTFQSREMAIVVMTAVECTIDLAQELMACCQQQVPNYEIMIMLIGVPGKVCGETFIICGVCSSRMAILFSEEKESVSFAIDLGVCNVDEKLFASTNSGDKNIYKQTLMGERVAAQKEDTEETIGGTSIRTIPAGLKYGIVSEFAHLRKANSLEVVNKKKDEEMEILAEIKAANAAAAEAKKHRKFVEKERRNCSNLVAKQEGVPAGFQNAAEDQVPALAKMSMTAADGLNAYSPPKRKEKKEELNWNSMELRAAEACLKHVQNIHDKPDHSIKNRMEVTRVESDLSHKKHHCKKRVELVQSDNSENPDGKCQSSESILDAAKNLQVMLWNGQLKHSQIRRV